MVVEPVDLRQIDLLVDEGLTPTAPTSSARPSGASSTAERPVNETVERRALTLDT
jgi:hypothetical protein